MAQSLYLIDGHAQIFRAFYAVEGLSTPDGTPTGAVFGFTRMLLDLDRKHKPDYLVAVFDARGPTFRHEEYPEYKATRKPTPPELIGQVPVIQDVVAAYRIPVVELSGFEADDILGTFARQGEEAGLEVVIVTGDKDCGQLLTPHVRLYDVAKDRFTDVESFVAKKGIAPEKLPDLMGLWGDTSDNIPGVPGIGEKIGAQLIQQYGSLEKLLDYAHEIKGKRGEVLRANRDVARLSKRLATIRTDVPLRLDLEAARRREPDYNTLHSMFEKLHFRSLQRQLETDRAAFASSPSPASPSSPSSPSSPAEATTVGGAREASERRAAAGDGGGRGEAGATAPGTVPGTAFGTALGTGPEDPVGRNYVLVNTPEAFESFFAELSRQPRFALDTETVDEEGDRSRVDPMRSELVGVSFCWKAGEAYYLPFRGPAQAAERERQLAAATEKKKKNAAASTASSGESGDGGDQSAGAVASGGGGLFGGAAGEAGAGADGVNSQAVGDTRVLGPEEFARLKPVLANPAVHKTGQNLKFDRIVLERAGAPVFGQTFDTLIANSLVHGGVGRQDLDALALRHLNIEKIPTADLIGSGRNQRGMDAVDLERIRDYACEDADVVWRLTPRLRGEIDRDGRRGLFEDLELPLSFVLAEMQMTGIRVDVDNLAAQSAELGLLLESLTEEIHAVAGKPFNIASPKQLADILFVDMGLSPAHRTGSGAPSTDESTLAALAHQGVELARRVLEYRAYAKLKGTYLDTLPLLAHPKTRRVHTTFSQTVTATGRLSSSNPNLQNIPVRTDRGRAVRAAFVPEDGWRMVAADYSQVELRMLAHFSSDPALLAAFAGGKDIHRAVAAEVAGVPEYEVTKEMRSAAKAVNFGIVYGQSAYGLAETTGMGTGEAQRFISDYFERYPRVREWLDRAVRLAHEAGGVETLLGRRRLLPELKSQKKSNVARAEREAVNTIIQGSAADLVKTAMVNLRRRMERARMRSRMLLQIHDELLFESPPGEADALCAMVREEMENALPLDVGLVVDIGVGDNWLEVK